MSITAVSQQHLRASAADGRRGPAASRAHRAACSLAAIVAVAACLGRQTRRSSLCWCGVRGLAGVPLGVSRSRWVAIVVCLLLAATAAGSHAQTPEPLVSLSATLHRGLGSQVVEPPLMRMGGRLNRLESGRTVYAIFADLLRFPCADQPYRFRVAVSVGRTYTTYDALLVLRKPTSRRLRCGAPVAKRYGPRVKIRIYDKRNRHRAIVVAGTRQGQTRIVGTLTISAILCRSSRLRATFRTRSGSRVSVRYDIAFQRVLVNGRPC
jgi:hypothetical protein